MGRFKVGDTVVFTEVPESLVHDLPDEDRTFIGQHVNQVAVIEKIEPEGFYWLGFDVELIDGKAQANKNHWFCVQAESLESSDCVPPEDQSG